MDHYLYLFSSAPTRYTGHKNHLLHFITELNRPLELEGEWEVGLKELFYPKLVGVQSLFFFVYLNICGFSHVGHKQYQILRPVLLKNSNDKKFVCNYDRFSNDIYMPVNEKNIKHLEIQLETDLDLPLNSFNFAPGEVIAVLHLKRVSK